MQSKSKVLDLCDWADNDNPHWHPSVTQLTAIIRCMEGALRKLTLSAVSQSRLDEVSAEYLRMIVLHGSNIAEDTLAQAERIAGGTEER